MGGSRGRAAWRQGGFADPAPQGGTLLRRPQAAKLPCNRNLYLTLGMSSIRPVGKLPSSSWLAWRICSMVVP